MLHIHMRKNCRLVGIRKSPLLDSLSDSRLATAFFIFFVTNRSSLPSKLGKPLWGKKSCKDEHTFCLNSAKCWICPLGPVMKFDHCQQYKYVGWGGRGGEGGGSWWKNYYPFCKKRIRPGVRPCVIWLASHRHWAVSLSLQRGPLMLWLYLPLLNSILMGVFKIERTGYSGLHISFYLFIEFDDLRHLKKLCMIIYV